MIAPGPGVRVYLATQPCDMRKGMDGLAAQVQNVLAADPFSGALFVFRGKRGDILKILAWDGSGLCLFPSGSSRAGSSGRRSWRADFN
jgi:transposase